MFKTAWSIVTDPKSNSQVAVAIAAILACTAVGLIGCLVMGVAVRGPGISNSVAGGLVAVFAGIGSFAVGGAMGLLFGSPNWGGANPGAHKQEDAVQAAVAPEGARPRPNTSLERIADWLTTMIVGLSLVHLKTIEARATDLAVSATRAISGDAQTTNGTPGIVIILFFGVSGFLLVYLWALRFLPSELRQSYLEQRTQQLENNIEIISQQLSEFKSKEIYQVPDYSLTASDLLMKQEGVDDETRAEIATRYRVSSRGSDEPMKDFGPTEDRGYALSAQVADQGNKQYKITVHLETPSGMTSGVAFWLLHNSFAPDVISRYPIDAKGASYETIANEAFWVGAAVAISGSAAIRLSFDLAQAQGATESFRTGIPAPGG